MAPIPVNQDEQEIAQIRALVPQDMWPSVLASEDPEIVLGQVIVSFRDARAKWERIVESWDQEVAKRLRSCGVPPRFVNAYMSDFAEIVWKQATSSQEGTFISGESGTGKTHLAVALLRYELENAQPRIAFDPVHRDFLVISPGEYRFVSVPEILIEVKDTFRRDSGETERGILESLSKAEYLVLDDLGVEKASEFVHQTLYVLIDRRYRNMLRTTITSNLSLDSIAEKISDRIASRIAGMCAVVTLKGKDRRVRR